MPAATPLINLSDFSQLRLIAWNREEGARIAEDEAFALYEAHWRYVDPDAMDAAERALLARLTQQYGGGVFHV